MHKKNGLIINYLWIKSFITFLTHLLSVFNKILPKY
jgi:hypothetical protein